ncbi:hypothetical protein COCSUDRAFT_53240 [Coccomyxa subellipsoidea C-169]|uniref:Uncharacterized protein n=1 Tax=Coccomyxa subellipsoidea (strain C-169) TaxID=574566 RepID=I0Z0H9_COCSC|nr:hypothetical protein COCSUDRAFT_53240 [Coccomyxa subellipsoidea C-169]EIE24148.1 hypothetical protein COCSUDRAFT_53240 [Coccomyxa subellipsoidea C-169]|eukprot:XP_005648692.1 hypothetical protein COCSUDRAFT_53240 [Coccomyxa subellipsoidea C-169]
MSEGIQLTEPRVSGASTPSKRKPAEGKDALLTGRTSAALDTKTSSPHKGDRAFCGPTSSLRCCFSYTPFLSILGVLLLVVGTILYGHEASEAGGSVRRLLAAATGPNGDFGKLNRAYYAAWVVTVVVAVLAAVSTIIIQLWRTEQRLRAEGRVGTGFSTERRYVVLEYITVIVVVIMYAFCVWTAVWFAINLLIFAVVMIAEQVTISGSKLFTTVLPILRGWLDDAAASHDALGQLLAGNPAIGTAAPQFVETAFNTLIPDINAIGAFINKQTGNKISYLVNSLIAGSPAVGAGGVRYCPATTCIDLQQYTFMNNNACICNSPILVSIATQAGDARRHFLRALVGLVLVYLGSTLLLSRLSAEAAKIRYDVNLLWTNKFDRLIMRRARAGENNNVPLAQVGSMRTPQGTPSRGSSQYIV